MRARLWFDQRGADPRSPRRRRRLKQKAPCEVELIKDLEARLQTPMRRTKTRPHVTPRTRTGLETAKVAVSADLPLPR